MLRSGAAWVSLITTRSKESPFCASQPSPTKTPRRREQGRSRRPLGPVPLRKGTSSTKVTLPTLVFVGLQSTAANPVMAPRFLRQVSA